MKEIRCGVIYLILEWEDDSDKDDKYVAYYVPQGVPHDLSMSGKVMSRLAKTICTAEASWQEDEQEADDAA